MEIETGYEASIIISDGTLRQLEHRWRGGVTVQTLVYGMVHMGRVSNHS